MLSQSAAESNPGSFSDFTNHQGMNPSAPESVILHGEALSVYRQALAAEHNMSLDDLHSFFGRYAIEVDIAA